ncbi:hypothetical protein KP509_29G056300 [Ceratopteris richardii]|nr:hypothetical protein KP509_29G056300 [Ceratopteris richardii]
MLHKFCRKEKVNPYAQRGLEKFARVSAELQEIRKKLDAQLDSPSAVIRFSSSSDQKWIPIVVSKGSPLMDTHAPSVRASEYVMEEKFTATQTNESSYCNDRMLFGNSIRCNVINVLSRILWLINAILFGLSIFIALLHNRRKDHGYKGRTIRNSSASGTKDTDSIHLTSGQNLAIIGLFLILCGLANGYLTSILIVVCWWYMLPGIRRAAGEKPLMRKSPYRQKLTEN